MTQNEFAEGKPECLTFVLFSSLTSIYLLASFPILLTVDTPLFSSYTELLTTPMKYKTKIPA